MALSSSTDLHARAPGRSLRVLHLFANHKVTGPAELALDTARAVEQHANGSSAVESLFAPARHPSDPPWLSDLARSRGARLAEIDGLRLSKHFNPIRATIDAGRLHAFLDERDVDLIHCHLPNDHLIATLAAARRRSRRVPIVRTLYDGSIRSTGWRSRRTLGRYSDHIICFSREVSDELVHGRLHLPAERVSVLDAPIDTDRFDPRRRAELADGRERLGIPPDAFTAGIVARMQTHRRFEVLLDAVKILAERIPGFRFVIVGRGTNQEVVAREPVRRMGLSDTVVFAGYLSGDEYVSTLLALDVNVFLVPGSDGTCRAVREALASGVPVVAARRGMLPEIVEDGVTGRVIDDTAEGLASAIAGLTENRDELERMARRARERAEERFTYARYARALLDIYRRVLDR